MELALAMRTSHVFQGFLLSEEREATHFFWWPVTSQAEKRMTCQKEGSRGCDLHTHTLHRCTKGINIAEASLWFSCHQPFLFNTPAWNSIFKRPSLYHSEAFKKHKRKTLKKHKTAFSPLPTASVPHGFERGMEGPSVICSHTTSPTLASTTGLLSKPSHHSPKPQGEGSSTVPPWRSQ